MKKCLRCDDREMLPSGLVCPDCLGRAAVGVRPALPFVGGDGTNREAFLAATPALFDGEAAEAAGDLREEGTIEFFPKEEPTI